MWTTAPKGEKPVNQTCTTDWQTALQRDTLHHNLLSSTFLIKAATPQSSSYPIVLRRSSGLSSRLIHLLNCGSAQKNSIKIFGLKNAIGKQKIRSNKELQIMYKNIYISDFQIMLVWMGYNYRMYSELLILLLIIYQITNDVM